MKNCLYINICNVPKNNDFKIPLRKNNNKKKPTTLAIL